MTNEPTVGTVPLTVAGLLAAVALTVALRAVIVPAGLPLQLDNPDEFGHLDRSLRIARGNPDPGFYIYPSLHYYLLATTLRIRHGAEVSDDPLGGWSSRFVLTSRMLGVVLGVGSVLAMFLAGRQLTGCGLGGVLAALFTAVNPTHLGVTSGTSVDASMSLFLCLTLWAVIRICQTPSLGNCILAGLFAGLATSCKQPGFALFPLILLAYGLATPSEESGPKARIAVWVLAVLAALVASVFLVLKTFALPELVQQIFGAAAVDETLARERYDLALAAGSAFLLRGAIGAGLVAVLLFASSALRRLVARMLFRPAPLTGLLVGVVAFACTSPFLLLEYRQTLRAMLHLAYQGFAVKLGRGFVLGAWDYLLQLGGDHGWLWLLLAVVTGAVVAWRRWTPGLVLGIAAVGYFLAFAGHGTPFPWYMVPASHALDLLAVMGLVLLWGRLSAARYGVAGWTIVAGVCLAWPLTTSMERAPEAHRPDTRSFALAWIADHLPADAVLVRTAMTPQTEVLGDRYQTIRIEYGMEKMGADYLHEQHADYVILSSVLYKTWRRAPIVYARELRGYEWVEENLEPVKRFRPDDRSKGPEITIYRVNPS